jgi:serine/threonine protein kinase
MQNTDKRERFGRYLILDHLVDGGMAKICRARFLGEQADKVVAIKMIQSKYSTDEQFKTMFMDEIKVTFGLNHPNIIQTYDYGIHNEHLFVAMEYCNGRNLKEYLKKLNGSTFPVEMAIYIIAEASKGLLYAHQFTDPLTGKKSHIIHRDISPHNIMLTFDGDVKVIDFGIAKSKTNSDATIAGTIKGKPSYLAPEYIQGKELDGRYDQFALGITLWEMLCAKKLFNVSNNQLDILKQINECKIPLPSSINKNVSPELDAIILKMLSRDRENRYNDLDELNRVLIKFLYTKFPDFNAKDISHFASLLFKEEIKIDKEKMFAFGTLDLKPYLQELKNESSGTLEVKQPKTQIEKLDEFEDLSPQPVPPVSPVAQNSTRGNLKLSQNNKTRPLVSVRPIDQTTSKINQDPDQLEYRNKKIAVAISVLLCLIAYGGYSKFNKYTASVPEKKLVRTPAQIPVITEEAPLDLNLYKSSIILSNFDKQKMQAFINGRKMEVDLLSTIKAPFGTDFTLRIQNERKKHFIKELKIEDDKPLEMQIPDTEVASYAYLNTVGKCPSGELRYQVFEEKRLSKIPLIKNTSIGLSLNLDEKGQAIQTQYQLFFKPRGSSIEKQIDVTLDREDQFINLCKLLNQ